MFDSTATSLLRGGAYEASAPVAPGVDAMVWLSEFSARGADRSQLIDAVAVVQSQLAWLASVEAAALAGLHELDDVDLGDVPVALRETMREQGRDWVSEEVGLVLRIPARFARDRMVVAHQLVNRLPETLGQLRAGTVTPRQTRVLAEAVMPLSDEACVRVQSRVLGRAPLQTNAQFARSVKRAVLAVAPTGSDEAAAAAVAERQVQITPLENGMAELWALLPAPEAMRLKTAIWRLGQHRRRVPGTDAGPGGGLARAAGSDRVDEFARADQRRADALVELGDRYLAESDPTGAVGRQAPAVQVTVSLETLLGIDSEPGELAGYGPIPAALARQIAFDPGGTWRRLVTDPLGQLIDYGQTRYEPPRRLAEHVRARDQQCVFPSCNRRADACELDHTIAWQHGGPTADYNLAPLCRRHHHLKHEGGWKLTREPTTGEHVWVSPTGRRYRNPQPH